MLSELLSNGVFGGFEGKIGNEDGIASRALVVSKVLGAVLTLGRRSFGLGKVNIDSAAIDFSFVHSLLGLDAIGAVHKLNIAKSAATSALIQIMTAEEVLPFGTAGVTISNDPNARQLPKALELTCEPFFIDVVRKMTNEKVPLSGFIAHGLGLGLLSCRCCFNFRLALLRSWSSGLLVIFFALFLR